MAEQWIVTCETCGEAWDMNRDPEACTCYTGDESHLLIIVPLPDAPTPPSKLPADLFSSLTSKVGHDG